MTHRSPRRTFRSALAGVAALVVGLGLVSIAPAAQAAPVAAAQRGAAKKVAPGVAPKHLTVGQLAAPVDVENLTHPLLGWQVGAGVQTAYEVEVATTSGGLDDAAGADVWDSGKITSSKNANVEYDGPALTTSSGYYWRVRTWDAADTASSWSAVSHFGTGPGSTWSGATPIWTPGTDSGWADYTYSGTFNIAGVAASVNFRAKDSNNFYMWQFRASDATADPSTLKTHANVAGSYGVLEVNALPFALLKNTDYDFRIVVTGSNISTYLKASADSQYVFVNSIDNSSFTAGGIGFRTGSTESAYYDNLKVTDPTGKVLYSNDFATASTDFTCGTVASGRLFIGTSKNCNYGVDWQNYAAQGTFTITQGTAAMSLKATSTSSFYLWQLKVGTPGTIQINKNVAGTFTTLKTITLSKNIVLNQDYVLKVVALGNTYQTYLDGVLVDTLTDATYSTGRIGFRTGGFEAFKVRDVSVTTPDGQVFYANTFPAGNTDFSCGTIAANTLTVPINSNCVVAAPSTNWAFLRGDVTLEPGKDIAWAHLYATGGSTNGARQFVYKMWVNGHYVGIGPTRPIGSETRYDGYDVRSLLNGGAKNTIGAMAYTTTDQRYLAQLVVRYTDGSTQTFGTGSSWKALNGSAVLPDAGSIGTSYYAAPKENVASAQYPYGFDTPAYDDSAWKAPALKPAFSQLAATPTAKVERQLHEPASVVEYSPGSYFIDYGRTWVGGLSLDLTGTAGQAVDIRYGEVTSAANTVKYATDGGNNYQDVWTLKAGSQHLETWGMRVFRYVQVLNAPAGLTKADFPAMAYVYPYDATAGVFASSNDNLNKVWQLNKNTIEATNGNLYVDSWERERGAYEADSYLQMMSNFYTSSDPTLGNYSIAYLFKQRTWPTEWPIYIILAMHDSYAQTGDIDALDTYYTALQGKLPEQWFEASTGLVRKTSGSNGTGSCTDCDIVDWPTSERDGYSFTQYNTVINAISYRAYEDMAEIASALGKTADAATYTARASAIRAAVNAKMWDASKGAYRDGLSATQVPTDHWAVQASIFATAFGLADDSQAAAVASYLSSREAASADGIACSVYCSAFLYEALYNGDRGDIAFNQLTSTKKRSYLNMIAAGAGATAEAWDKSLKSNLTYSHPWAASIAYNMPQGLFGIKPTTAGYDTYDVKPQADSLDWAHVTVPTLKGSVGAAFDRTASGIDVGVSVPANAAARVFVPATTETTQVYVDGRATTATYVDGYAVVTGVAPGCHVLSLAAGTAPGEDSRLTGICPDGWTAPVDSTPPTVTATLDPATPSGLAGWYVGSAQLTLTAADSESAVASVEYRVGAGDWTPYTAPVDAPEGVTTYGYRATDTVGNVSEAGTVTVKRDVTAPTVSASYDDEDGHAEGPVTVTLAGADGGSGLGSVSWSLDGGDWTTYDGGVSVAGGGAHQLDFQAVDVAGNVSDPGSETIMLAGPDTTAPTVLASTDPQAPTGALGWFTGPASLVLTATDEGSGVASVEYRVGPGDWTPYAGPVVAPEGSTTYGFRATDVRGNVSEPGTTTVQRDVTRPTVSATFDDEDGGSEGPVPVTITATDDGSGVATVFYRVDGGAWTTYDGPVAVTGAGSHVLELGATDVAGNTSEVGEVTVRIIAPDTTPPVVTAAPLPAAPSGPSAWFTEPVSVELTAVDERSAVASVEYTLDNGVWQTYTTPVDIAEGTHEVHYRATDAHGNVSETGRLVVRRDQTAPSSSASFDDQDGRAEGPVEVTLVSTDDGSGVGSVVYSVDGGAQTTYTGPFPVTGSGATITFHAVDVAGNVEQTRTATVRLTLPDTTPPVVTGSTSPATPTGAHGWFTGAVGFSLVAVDDRSGVAALEYRVGDGAWMPWTTVVTVPQGTTTYSFRATDGKGNTSAVQSLTVKRDTVAPSSTASYDDGDGTGPGPVAVTFAGTDTTSGVDSVSYRIDAGTWQVAAGPVQVSGNGTHVVDWYATDLAGNQEPLRSLTVEIGRDLSGPAVSAATTPVAPTGSNGWFTGVVSVTLTADDPSGVALREYRVGSGPWQSYTGPVLAPDGTTAYSFRATDTLGNVSSVVRTTVARDTTAPVTTATYDDDGGATLGPVPVTLAATDAVSGVASIAYSVDGGAWRAYDGTLVASGAGAHLVRFAATDAAGNVEVEQQVTVVIAAPDRTPPRLVVTAGPGAPTGAHGWYVGRVTVGASASDASGVARLEYRAGGSAWRTYTGTLVAPQGVSTYSFRATDTAGNTSGVVTRTVKRDTSAPRVGLTVAKPGGRRIVVRLTGADPQSGVLSLRYRVDGRGWRTFTGPIRLTGSHVVRFQSVNRAGLASAVRTRTVGPRG